MTAEKLTCGKCALFSENFTHMRHPAGWGNCKTPDTDNPVMTVTRNKKACSRFVPKEAA